MREKSRKIIPALLALVLFVGATGCSMPTQPDDRLTFGQARDLVHTAASHYRTDLKKEDVHQNIPDATSREQEPVTRAEALVMVDNAFGALPEPTGHLLRVAPQPVTYSELPPWAKGAVANLNKAKVLYSVRDGLDSGGEEMRRTELVHILERIYALFATNLKDDFYTAVNNEWLGKSQLPEDETSVGVMETLANKASTQYDEMLENIVKGRWQAGTPERKLADFYESVTNMAARNKAGAAPLKPYLDALTAATDLKSFEEALRLLADDLAFYPLFSFLLRPDDTDKSRYNVCLFVKFSNDFTGDDIDSPEMKAYAQKVEKLFRLSGDKTPAKSAKRALTVALALANSTEDVDDEKKANAFKQITMGQLKALFPEADIEALYAQSRLKEEPVYHIQGGMELVLNQLATMYKTRALDSLKDYCKYLLLYEYGELLGQDFVSARIDGDHADSPDSIAKAALATHLGKAIDDAYLKRYFSPVAQQAVTTMVEEFIADYKERLGHNTWMSADTKKMALKKLDTMVVKVGGQTTPDDIINLADIRATNAGGSYFANVAAINKIKQAKDIAKQGKPVDRTEWITHPYASDAFYSPTMNEIVFSAAVLQAPYFSLDAKPEENLAGIGWIIAHEITHAFDIRGSQYDENGNKQNWWTEADKRKFEELCESVAQHYNGYEVAPGLMVDGKQTLGENTADLAGLSAALDSVKKLDRPDYRLFFTHTAKMWQDTYTRSHLASLVRNDEHSPAKARINKALQTFAEFYEVFDIKQGDGMYLPPDNRVKIW